MSVGELCWGSKEINKVSQNKRISCLCDRCASDSGEPALLHAAAVLRGAETKHTSGDMGGYYIVLYLFAEGADVEVFHFFARPGRFAEKCKARFYARVVLEAVDRNSLRQLVPAEFVHQLREDGF